MKFRKGFLKQEQGKGFTKLGKGFLKLENRGCKMKNRECFLSKNGICKNEKAFDFRKIRIAFGDKRRFIAFYKPKKKI